MGVGLPQLSGFEKALEKTGLMVDFFFKNC
jgi:hypothetical protein